METTDSDDGGIEEEYDNSPFGLGYDPDWDNCIRVVLEHYHIYDIGKLTIAYFLYLLNPPKSE